MSRLRHEEQTGDEPNVTQEEQRAKMTDEKLERGADGMGTGTKSQKR